MTTANTYQGLSRWRVKGTCGEVADVLGNPLALPHWWPAVYLEVREIEPPAAHGVGQRVSVRTKGWLPYWWAMAQGETSLRLELARRRATSDAARAAIPAPPGPVTYAGVAIVAGAAAVGGTLAYLLVRSRKRSRISERSET